MRLEATTRIDYQSYHDYFIFNFLRGRHSPWQAPVLLAVSPLLTIVFLILYLQNPHDIVNMAGLILMPAMGLMLLAILTLLPRRYYRSIQKLLLVPNHYVFEEEQFSVRSEKPQLLDVAPTSYKSLHQAFETPRYFYLYLGRGQACIIGKQDFTSGTAEDLHRVLQASLGDRLDVVKSRFFRIK